jgi:hypothetical protein
MVVPLVDVLSAERHEKAALLEEVAAATQVAEVIEQFESRVAVKTAQLAEFEARAVSDETLPALRTKLVELARDTGCSLRRLNVGASSSRPWYSGDNPIVAPAGARPAGVTPSFTLQWWPTTVSLSGTDVNLRNLLDHMEADGMLMHTKSIEMHPASEGRKILDLDLELWFFNLTRGG